MMGNLTSIFKNTLILLEIWTPCFFFCLFLFFRIINIMPQSGTGKIPDSFTASTCQPYSLRIRAAACKSLNCGSDS